MGPPAKAARSAQLRAGRVLALCDALLSERGEVSGARFATDALSEFLALDLPSRELFFDRLNTEFDPPLERGSQTARAFEAQPSAEHLLALQEIGRAHV